MGNLTQDFDESLSIDCFSLDNIEACSDLILHAHNFVSLTLNIRSIQQNFDAFLVTFTRLNSDIDIIILTECWLNENSIIPKLPGYNSYRTHKFINKSGGVIAYIKESLCATVEESTCTDCNCLEIKLGSELLLMGIYRSPSFLDVEPFLLSLNDILKVNNLSNIIITGDLNLDICAVPLSEHCSEYITLLAEYQLLPAITKPTRANTCLDHYFVKNPSQETFGIVCSAGITDHSICLLATTTKKIRPLPKRFYSKTDYDAVAKELSSMDWTAVIGTDNVNNAVKSFSNIIELAVANHTSQSKQSRKKCILKPWITPGLIKCQRQRDRLHLQARNNPSNLIIQITYKRYRNFLNNIQNKLKTTYENQLLKNNKNNPKKLWQSIKDICHLNKSHSNCSELITSKSDPKSSLNYCNNFFANIGKHLADKTLNDLSVTQDFLASNTKLKKFNNKSFFMTPTDENEVESLILDLKPDSAPGIDKCSPVLIKTIRKSIVIPLTHIFNISLSSGVFPEIWKVAIVSPIFKNGEKNNPNNYRPISLLIIFSKLLEKIVNKRVTTFLKHNNLISDRQFGFRQGKSTEDAVLLLCNTVSGALDANKRCIGVFLDLTKAFDTVSVPILLQKLNCLGIRGVPYDWFQSYLSSRSQRIRIGENISDELPINFGVPQGSILGPTLFLVYINDVLDLQIDNADTVCYADDTAVIFQGTCWEDVYKTAEKGMGSITNWLSKNLLTLNLCKTKYIAFHKTITSQPPQSNILKLHLCDQTQLKSFACNCSPISRIDHIKYLGVTIDQNLSYKTHIANLSKRLRKSIYIMKSIRNSAPRNIVILVYKALCQSLLMYCIKVWGGSAKTILMELERAQRAVLRVMLRKPFRHRTNQVYQECKVLRVRQLFIQRAVTDIHRKTLKCKDYDKLVKQRVYKVPLPNINTAFAKRHPRFLLPYIYNKVCRKVDIKTRTTYGAQRVVEDWLMQLDYSETEGILQMF
jgi:hypothetical protein